MDIFLIIVAGVLMIIAFIGCIVPALPGPILGYAGMWHHNPCGYPSRLRGSRLVHQKVRRQQERRVGKYYRFNCRHAVANTIRFSMGAVRRCGSRRTDSWHDHWESLKSGMGSFVGFILSTGLKIAVVVAFCVLYCQEVWNAYF